MTRWHLCASLSLVCLCALLGCESPKGMQGGELAKALWTPKPSSHEQEMNYRKDYQTTRSRKALRWLLANCVESGMSRRDVDTVVGEPGELEENSGWLKRNSTYRVDDKVYRYGPDDGGRVVYLFFRDEKLVNFERERFADSGRSFSS